MGGISRVSIIGGLSYVFRTWKDIRIMLQTGYSGMYYLCEALLQSYESVKTLVIVKSLSCFGYPQNYPL